jgi:16S rRNA (guanine966-N2)-methyltransferase
VSGGNAGPRVTAGRLAGRRLVAPASIRPSSGRVREALFSIWTAEIAGAELLDLFAGSGAIGIEGWSRGARRVTLAECDRRSLAALRRNLTLLPADSARLLAEPVPQALARLLRESARFDLIFADPPYDEGLGEEFFAAASGVAATGARLVVEHRAGSPPPEACAGWRRAAPRRYGDSALSVYARETD